MLVGLSVGKRESRPWIVSDELWSLIEPLLPEPGPKLVGGRPRVPGRQALLGILFVPHTGIQWEYPLLARIPSVPGLVGRPRRLPDILLGDRGYDHDKYRRPVRAQGVKPVIARRGVPHGSGLGVHRRVVERAIAWFHGFRRLRIRWERRDDIHEAFLGLATRLITHRHVQRLCWDLQERPGSRCGCPMAAR
ncbi:transposase [Streptomyces sp. 150FB]|uniref:transposase n=1 Tax=Streptomyces sp. 150FB TaxID=1576605 RepID=UPI000D145666|nr:transposase [Streptomyces sp. 150FB]